MISKNFLKRAKLSLVGLILSASLTSTTYSQNNTFPEINKPVNAKICDIDTSYMSNGSNSKLSPVLDLNIKVPLETYNDGFKDDMIKEFHKSKLVNQKKDSTVKAGLRNESFVWSYGPEYHNSSFYIQVGTPVFSKWIHAYVEVSGNNPVLKEGFKRPGNSDETVDLSPNTHIAGFAGGTHVTIYDNQKWALRTGVRYEQIGEFTESQRWIDPANERSDIHVDGITSLSFQTWIERNFKNFGSYIGVEGKSSYAKGEALTYYGNSTLEEDARFDSLNQRDNRAVNALMGCKYNITDGWALKIESKGSSKGFGGEVGFSHRF